MRRSEYRWLVTYSYKNIWYICPDDMHFSMTRYFICNAGGFTAKKACNWFNTYTRRCNFDFSISLVYDCNFAGLVVCLWNVARCSASPWIFIDSTGSSLKSQTWRREMPILEKHAQAGLEHYRRSSMQSTHRGTASWRASLCTACWAVPSLAACSEAWLRKWCSRLSLAHQLWWMVLCCAICWCFQTTLVSEAS